jgi:ABC-2 type transport system ATP-binding protein
VFLTTQYLEEADQLAERIAIIGQGRIVREGAPAALKEQVGAPTLTLRLDAGHVEAARRELCARFGAERPASRAGELAIGLEGGAQQMTEVVRLLDEIGAHVEHIELMQPTLDDVFADATGRRLEGAEESDAGTDPIAGARA